AGCVRGRLERLAASACPATWAAWVRTERGADAARLPRRRRAHAGADTPARRRSFPQRGAGEPACLLRSATRDPFATRRASPPLRRRSLRPLRDAREGRGLSPSSAGPSARSAPDPDRFRFRTRRTPWPQANLAPPPVPHGLTTTPP